VAAAKLVGDVIVSPPVGEEGAVTLTVAD